MTETVQLLTRRHVTTFALAAPAILSSAAHGDAPITLRASLDTSPTHARTISVADYLKKVEAASNGRIKTELFHSGQLFNDRDVTKALVQGQAEMAVPGVWVLTAFVPDCDMLNLPVFYGHPIEFVHRTIDGKPGALVNATLETKLHVKVLGPWLDLGFTNWFSTRKPLNNLGDLSGMKLRNSGGAAQAWRASFFGAIPNATPWPDVPLALAQGAFDGLATTDESAASASLWDSGVRYGLEDHQNVGEYIPMLSPTFWDGLSPDLRSLLVQIWRDNIAAYRQTMADAQSRARTTLAAHGIRVLDVSPDELAQARKKMIARQDEAARLFKLSPHVVELIMAEQT